MSRTTHVVADHDRDAADTGTDPPAVGPVLEPRDEPKRDAPTEVAWAGEGSVPSVQRAVPQVSVWSLLTKLRSVLHAINHWHAPPSGRRARESPSPFLRHRGNQ